MSFLRLKSCHAIKFLSKTKHGSKLLQRRFKHSKSTRYTDININHKEVNLDDASSNRAQIIQQRRKRSYLKQEYIEFYQKELFLNSVPSTYRIFKDILASVSELSLHHTFGKITNLDPSILISLVIKFENSLQNGNDFMSFYIYDQIFALLDSYTSPKHVSEIFREQNFRKAFQEMLRLSIKRSDFSRLISIVDEAVHLGYKPTLLTRCLYIEGLMGAGRLQEAEDHLSGLNWAKSGTEVSKARRKQRLVFLYESLAIKYFVLENYLKACEYFEKMIKIKVKLNDLQFEKDVRTAMVFSLSALQQDPMAIQLHYTFLNIGCNSKFTPTLIIDVDNSDISTNNNSFLRRLPKYHILNRLYVSLAQKLFRLPSHMDPYARLIKYDAKNVTRDETIHVNTHNNIPDPENSQKYAIYHLKELENMMTRLKGNMGNSSTPSLSTKEEEEKKIFLLVKLSSNSGDKNLLTILLASRSYTLILDLYLLVLNRTRGPSRNLFSLDFLEAVFTSSFYVPYYKGEGFSFNSDIGNEKWSLTENLYKNYSDDFDLSREILQLVSYVLIQRRSLVLSLHVHQRLANL